MPAYAPVWDMIQTVGRNKMAHLGHRGGRSALKLCPIGKYAHRQPFAYPPLRDLCAPDLQVVDRVEQADIIVLSHSKDLLNCADILAGLGDQKIVLLSEEPFWDTIWGADPFARDQQFDHNGQTLSFSVLNHSTSGIFDFDQIPYFLLTDHSYAGRYAYRFRINARKSAADWKAHFAAPALQAAFVAEKRLGEKFAVSFPQQDTYGLCRFRSQLTAVYQTGAYQRGAYQTGDVLRAGLGWRKGVVRQALPDWHLEKLLELDGRCRFVSALENTHQRTYVTEKFFDAFAVGGVPLYYASPAHRIHGIVPAGTWVNLFGQTPEQAVETIDAFPFEDAFYDRYTQAQAQLADLFCTPQAMIHERARLRDALIGALQTLTA